jgi:hypothetical protein
MKKQGSYGEKYSSPYKRDNTRSLKREFTLPKINENDAKMLKNVMMRNSDDTSLK